MKRKENKKEKTDEDGVWKVYKGKKVTGVLAMDTSEPYDVIEEVKRATDELSVAEDVVDKKELPLLSRIQKIETRLLLIERDMEKIRRHSSILR